MVLKDYKKLTQKVSHGLRESLDYEKISPDLTKSESGGSLFHAYFNEEIFFIEQDNVNLKHLQPDKTKVKDDRFYPHPILIAKGTLEHIAYIPKMGFINSFKEVSVENIHIIGQLLWCDISYYHHSLVNLIANCHKNESSQKELVFYLNVLIPQLRMLLQQNTLCNDRLDLEKASLDYFSINFTEEYFENLTQKKEKIKLIGDFIAKTDSLLIELEKVLTS